MRRLAGALALGVACLLPAHAEASSRQYTIFQAPHELLSADAGLRARTFEEIRGFGVRDVRIILYWQAVAPEPDASRRPAFDDRDPAAYHWGSYADAIDEAHARGMRVLLTVSGPVPRWATAHHRDHRTRPSPTLFRRFVAAVGRRFGSEVSTWSIWNEPNHPRFLLPQYTKHGGAVSGRIYRQLFLAGWRGLRDSGNGRARLLMGETAPRGTGKVVPPLVFLRRALCLDRFWRRARGCSNLPADGYAHHAYTTREGPWFVPPSPNDVTIGTLHRLNRALYRAALAGAVRRNLGIYLTEFGIQSKPDPFLGVSFTAQAEYRSIAERIAYRNPRVRAFSQYLMRDDPAGPPGPAQYRGFESGLRLNGGAQKLAYDGFRLPLVAVRGRRRVTLWGLVRPAHARTVVTIEYRARGGRRWHRLKDDRTDARGYWTTTTRLRAGRRYRVAWRGVTGPLTRAYRP